MMPSDNNLKKYKIFIQFIGLLSLFIIFQCTEEPIKPKPNIADTTSHNFIWEVDTLGEYGSFLKDAAIINDSTIWVVGNIETDTGTFNAAKWNGQDWHCYSIVTSGPLYSIFYFNKDDIWVTSFGYPKHWNGNDWLQYHLHNLGIDASAGYGIWGTSSSNIFFVGINGSIVHYDGSRFTKMESGTDAPIVDIWGIDENHIWAVAYTNSWDDNHPDGYESVVYSYDGNQWIRKYVASPENHSAYSETEIAGYMASLWAYRDTLYISSHSGLWKESIKTGKGEIDHGPDNRLDGYPFLVRGTGYNDIYAFTHWAEFMHYNGKTWYQDLTLDRFYVDGATVKNDNVVLVGDLNFLYAIVVRGYHLH